MIQRGRQVGLVEPSLFVRHSSTLLWLKITATGVNFIARAMTENEEKEIASLPTRTVGLIGHFRVHRTVSFKASLCAKSLLGISAFIHIESRTKYRDKNFALRLALKE